MASEGELGNLGEPRVSLSEAPEEQGYRLTKSPGASSQLSAASEPAEGTQSKGATKVLGSEQKRSDPRRARGSRSGA